MAKATIKDVAKYANVSVSTVSNVINGLNKCSEETKLKILEAMNELNYKPNLTAKSLVQKKSHLIGVIYDGNDNSYERILQGIESYIRQNGEFDFITSNYIDFTMTQDWIYRRNLDGVILIGNFETNTLAQLKLIGKPIVLIDNYSETLEDIVYINSEDTMGAYLATEELIKAGVKEPYILRVKNNEISSRRLLGYLTCLEDYGIEFRNEMLLEVPKNEFLKGKIIGASIAQSEIKGLICTSDILALGVLKSLYNFKTSVPDSIKLIGFDNLAGSEYTNPSLTTMDTGSEKKGKKACETLIKLIENIKIKEYEINITIELIKRETV